MPSAKVYVAQFQGLPYRHWSLYIKTVANDDHESDDEDFEDDDDDEDDEDDAKPAVWELFELLGERGRYRYHN